jgi:thioredoxin:protein disulfide reductase
MTDRRRIGAWLLCLLAVLGPSSVALADDGSFARALERGPLFLAAASFGFGVLVSLTPCVYPMVAITVSVFGASKSKSRLQSLALSGMFVLGIVAMFVPLGIGAALTGKTFGSALSNPWLVVALSAFFLVLATSMFGAFDLDLPASLKNRLVGAGGAGYVGAFVLGLVCGPIAAPCTGPFLYGLLAFVAQTQSVSLGTAAMSAFALGLGAPFFLVGAFAMQLPKSGRWMMHVKSLMGIMLTVVALYFLGNSFPELRSWTAPSWGFLTAMAVLVVLGLLLGAVHKSFDDTESGTRVAKAVGIVLVSVASFGFVSGYTAPESTLSWEKPQARESVAALIARVQEKANRENRPVFMDFTAAWCAACKEIEKHTFPDDRVQHAAGRFVAVQLDMTDDSDPAVEQTFRRYAIRGLPTLILLDSSGQEAKRFLGDFVAPMDLVTAMEAVN